MSRKQDEMFFKLLIMVTLLSWYIGFVCMSIVGIFQPARVTIFLATVISLMTGFIPLSKDWDNA